MTADKLVAELFRRGLVRLDEGLHSFPQEVGDDEETHLIDVDALLRRGDRDELGLLDADALEDLADEVGPFVGQGRSRIPKEVVEEVSSTGLFETCAWYQPMHFFGFEWGILIREDCIKRMAQIIACFLPRPTAIAGRWLTSDLLRAAFFTYFLHEQFHHKVESFGIRLWVVEGAERYVPYKRAVYRPTLGKKDNLEEALANADCRRRLLTSRYRNALDRETRTATRAALDWIIEASPPGYKNAREYRGDSFQGGLWKLQSQIQEASLTPTRAANEWEYAPRATQAFVNIDQNIWSIVRAGASKLLPQAHVSPVATPSTVQVVRLLVLKGFAEAKGGKGSHRKFKRPNSPMVVLPGGRERLSPHVTKNVAHALGLNNIRELMDEI